MACAAADPRFVCDSYVYEYLTDPSWTDGALDTLRLAIVAGFRPVRVINDIEDVTSAAQRLKAAARIQAITLDFQKMDAFTQQHGLPRPPAAYSGKWWWDAYLPNRTDFAGRDLWPSQYDGVASPDVVTLFGGWTAERVIGKQYMGTSTVGGVGNVDLDIWKA